MIEEEQELVRDALEYVKSSGTTGVLKSKLLGVLRDRRGQILTPEQQAVIFGILTGRCWIIGYVEPLWHNTRYTLTAAGLTALEQM